MVSFGWHWNVLLFGKEVIEVTPILAATILPVVTLSAVLVRFLLCVLINHLDEVMSLKVIARVLLAPLAQCPLLILQPGLLRLSRLHVTVLKGALVWPQSRISRWQSFLEALGEMIHLNSELPDH